MKENIKRLIYSKNSEDISLGLLLLSQNKKLFKSFRGLDIKYLGGKLSGKITLKLGYIVIAQGIWVKYYSRTDNLRWNWLNEIE